MASSRIIFAVGPLIARPPTMGETATTGAPLVRSKSLSLGTPKMGSMDTNGFDGQMTMASGRAARAASRRGFTWADSMPVNAKPVTVGAQRSRTK